MDVKQSQLILLLYAKPKCSSSQTWSLKVWYSTDWANQLAWTANQMSR